MNHSDYEEAETPTRPPVRALTVERGAGGGDTREGSMGGGEEGGRAASESQRETMETSETEREDEAKRG